MKLLLIGQSVEDHIYYKNDYLIKPGGIYYSVNALLNIKDADDEVYLCTSYRKDDPLFKGLYEKVKPEFLNFTDVIPRVRLNIYDDKERKEIYENITGELDINTKDFSSFDGIIVNMVTGFDISLEQMKEIRKQFDGMIYFDVHTFSRGLNEEREREFRIIPEFDKWLENIDILQVNSRELFTIMNSDSKNEIIRCVLGANIKYLLETKGIEGAVCYSIDNSDILAREIPALPTDVKNQVGLGDVFGTVFFYTYIKTGSVEYALKLAVTAAGCAASYSSMDDFKNLKNDVFLRYN